MKNTNEGEAVGQTKLPLVPWMDEHPAATVGIRLPPWSERLMVEDHGGAGSDACTLSLPGFTVALGSSMACQSVRVVLAGIPTR